MAAVWALGAAGLIAILYKSAPAHEPPGPPAPAAAAADPSPTVHPHNSTRWRAMPRAMTTELEEDLSRLAEIGYVRGLRPAPDSGGVLLHDAERAHDGLNLYLSGHAPAAFLIDMDGRVRHEWRLAYQDAFPEVSPKVLQLDGSQYWRRVHLLDDGGLLVIFDYLGLVRIDRTSRVVWALPRGFHHHMALVGEHIYVLRDQRSVVPEVRATPIREDFVTVLDAEGRVVREVSLVRAFLNSPFADVLKNLPAGEDIFHTNTLQILDGSHAGRSTHFAKGHVLVCLRNLNRIAIVDLEREAVVWHLAGGWVRQHDSVLLANGNMLIFDNNVGAGRSRVVEFDPLEQTIHWTFEGTPEVPFYCDWMGTNQRLANGNTLITDSAFGQVMEVTPEGSIVWHFANPSRTGTDNELIAVVPDMFRIDRERVATWLGK